MASNFESRVNHVQPNSAVSAGNTSRATRELENRTNFLKAVTDASDAGRLLVRYNQSLHPDVLEGSPVYWNAETQQYDLALAAVANDVALGALVPAPSADCLGLCISKDSATSGNIGTMGMVHATPTMLANMINGDATPGRYYLSAATPGRLTRQRPPVSVAVAFLLGPSDACETGAWLFVLPQMRDFLEDHIHYQRNLTAAPAGSHTPPAPGGTHTITLPDVTQPGWLPADHASFDGAAPAGAAFGYNLAADPALAAVWPPIPASAAVLEMYQPTTGDSAITKLSRIPTNYVITDKNGIWWMTDCYEQVPWPADLDTTSSASSSSSAAATCPDNNMLLLLSFLKMTFASDKTVVTSLQPQTTSPLRYQNCRGEPATTGDLYADLDLQALLSPASIRGGQALKEIADSQLTFRRGWVAEGLIAGSDTVVLTGSHQELLDPTIAASPSNPVLHQGIITVDVQLDPTERELNPQVVKLGDALEREHLGITYIGLPPGRDSGIRMRYNIPPAGLPTNPQLKIRAKLFGRGVGPLSALALSYYRVTRPSLNTPVALAAGDTTVTFDVVTPSDDSDGLGTNLPADNAIEVESTPFTIAAGDTIYVTLERLSSAVPLFQADIGLIRIGGILVSGG